MKKTKVHFIGIAGSGMSGVAAIAAKKGYLVSGCDLDPDTPYAKELKNLKIKIYTGQSASHLKDIDLLAVTPAVFFQDKADEEIKIGKKKKIILTWQEFLGKYLQKNSEVICIAGTHGKSTTTAMASLLFAKANLDPNVIIGATIPEWHANYRVGKSKLFITEADEFFDNFLNYSPEVIIMNNIEFDHPDYFKDEKHMFLSFKKFILKLKGKKILIYNKDSQGIKKLFSLLGKKSLSQINLYGYSLKDKNIILSKDKTTFKVDGITYTLKVPGSYNVSNALGVITLANLYKVSPKITQKALLNFNSIGRRMELIGEKKGIKVYDDYAHHPTAIKVTLEALRQKYPQNKIWAIIEPHTFSRTKALLPYYKNAFNTADEIIIAPIYQSRDTQNFGISGESIVKVAGHPNIKFINDFEEIAALVGERAVKDDIVMVMGAGVSYKLSRMILEKL